METTPRAPDPVTCALVGQLINSQTLAWRHHGIGLLQAYVVQGGREVRLHVWHPELRFVDEDSGMIHDHRFHFNSQVLLGAIHDTEVVVCKHDTGRSPVYRVWEVENARQSMLSGDAWVREAKWGTTATPDGSSLCTIDTSPHIYNMGSLYSYPAWKFHRSEVRELTVTVCTKTWQEDGPARILARDGVTPKHGIGAPFRRSDPYCDGGIDDPRARFLQEASERLLEIARSGS